MADIKDYIGLIIELQRSVSIFRALNKHFIVAILRK